MPGKSGEAAFIEGSIIGAIACTVCYFLDHDGSIFTCLFIILVSICGGLATLLVGVFCLLEGLFHIFNS